MDKPTFLIKIEGYELAPEGIVGVGPIVRSSALIPKYDIEFTVILAGDTITFGAQELEELKGIRKEFIETLSRMRMVMYGGNNLMTEEEMKDAVSRYYLDILGVAKESVMAIQLNHESYEHLYYKDLIKARTSDGEEVLYEISNKKTIDGVS